MIKRLNIGCGRDIKKNFINVDMFHAPGVDKVYDLNKFPYPFMDNSFSEIHAISILEHLREPDKVVRELWRISKNDAKIKIVVPHYSSACAWADMTHIKPFSFFSFNHYDKAKTMGTSLNQGRDNILFQVNFSPYFPKIFRIIGISFLAKRFPKFYENFITFIFPCGGIEFDLVSKKISS